MLNQNLSVSVFFGDQQLGRLALAPDGRTVFEYAAEWLENGFSISPFYLPLKRGVFTARSAPFDGLFGVFYDSLPDGWGRLLTDRWLASKGYNPADFNVIDRLRLVGRQGMGALYYIPEQKRSEEESIYELDFYAQEATKILQYDETESLEALFDKAGSSGGARPKVLLTIDGTDWLIKFRSGLDPQNVGELEYQHSLLAKKCGIEMPPTRLFEGKYFGVARFDRQGRERFHVHSAAGLLYASYRLPSLDYTELLKATMILTKDQREVQKLFRQMVFNVLIGNKDDHAKNFAYIYQNHSWKLSPAYDLLPSVGFNNNHTTTINGQGKPELKDCLDVAKHISLPAKTAKIIIDEVHDGLV
jgi:serine/threonine-protein kinase HipA